MNKIEAKKHLLQTLLAATMSVSLLTQNPEYVSAEPMDGYETVDNSIPVDAQSILMYYCNVFNLDYNQVSLLLFNHSIAQSGMINVIDGVPYESTEEAILTFVYNLYFNSNEYGVNRNELTNGQNYEMQTTLEECLDKYCRLLNINSDIALSIVYSECGAPASSHKYLVKNNPAGIGPNMSFANKEVGIIYYAFLLKYSYGLTNANQAEFFDRVASKYCKVNPAHWTSMAKSFYSNISRNYYHYSEPSLPQVQVAKVLERSLTINNG